MRDSNLRSEKSIALEHVSTAWYAGTDADGGHHFWSHVDQTFVVVDGETAEVWHLDETPYDSPAEWRDHVAARRGWDDCRIGGSAIAESLEVLA
jgi:hypothetical protein